MEPPLQRSPWSEKSSPSYFHDSHVIGRTSDSSYLACAVDSRLLLVVQLGVEAPASLAVDVQHVVAEQEEEEEKSRHKLSFHFKAFYERT